MTRKTAWVLWIGPTHRIATCVEIRLDWLASYRKRVTADWRGQILGVYRTKVSGPGEAT